MLYAAVGVAVILHLKLVRIVRVVYHEPQIFRFFSANNQTHQHSKSELERFRSPLDEQSSIAAKGKMGLCKVARGIEIHVCTSGVVDEECF